MDLGSFTGRSGAIAAALVLVSLGGCETYRARPLPAGPLLASDPGRLKADVGALRVAPLKPLTVDLRDGVSPLEAGVLAVLNNPDLEAKRRALGVSEAQVFAAGLLPDLTVTGGVAPPVSGPDHGTSSNASLAVDLAGLLARANAHRAAQATARQVDLDLLWTEWTTAQQARQLVETALAAERKAQYLRNLLKVAAERSERSGRALEARDATLQTAAADLAAKLDAQAALTIAEQDAAKARRDLDGLLGLDASVALVLAEGPDAASWDADAVSRATTSLPSRRPDLLALRAGYEAQDATVRKAIIAQFPLTSLSADFARDPAGVVTEGLSGSLFLPIFNGGRGEARVQVATREQLRAEYQAKLDAADAEAKAAQAELARSQRTLAQLRIDAPRLEALVAPALTAYDRRDLDSQTYLTLSQAALNRRADLDDKALAARLAEITLETALFLPPAAARAAP